MVGRQTAAAIKISLLGLPRRAAASANTVIGVALVSLIFVGFLAMADGFARTMAAGASPDVAVILSRGAASEAQSSIDPGQFAVLAALAASTGATQSPLAGEVYTITSLPDAEGKDRPLTIRGTDSRGAALRKHFALSSGRMLQPGSREIIVGKQAAARFPALRPGATVRIGPAVWTVAGVFDDRGSAYESELWADLRTVQSAFDLGAGFRSARVKLRPGTLESFRAAVEREPRLQLSVLSDEAFFQRQSSKIVGLINGVGWPLGLAIALGAMAGALNTMYNSVAERSAEIATLRAIGFGRSATFWATLVESLILASLGGAIGAALGFLIFDSMSASTLGGGGSTVSFSFSVGPGVLLRAFWVTLLVGLIGGLFPALRAARQPIRAGLR